MLYFIVVDKLLENRYILSGDLLAGRVTTEYTKNSTTNTVNPPVIKKYWYHLDHLNSTKAVTKEDGTLEVLYEYRAFGEQLKRLDAAGTETGDNAKYSYGGKELDDESDLYYFNARYYDATTGRFINVDPIQDGTNWYVYCSNNPLNRVDPTGLDDEDTESNFGKVKKFVNDFLKGKDGVVTELIMEDDKELNYDGLMKKELFKAIEDFLDIPFKGFAKKWNWFFGDDEQYLHDLPTTIKTNEQVSGQTNYIQIAAYNKPPLDIIYESGSELEELLALNIKLKNMGYQPFIYSTNEGEWGYKFLIKPMDGDGFLNTELKRIKEVVPDAFIRRGQYLLDRRENNRE